MSGNIEPGQLVEVRGRQYVVTDIRPSALPADPLAPAPHTTQHLASLLSVDDDTSGEELEVLWEIEPGARVHDHGSLPAPDRFDSPDHLDAFLDAVRWGAVSSADRARMQAPFRSGIAIEEYQIEPLVRALDMPRVNLLIADDVGLGKTIEAGLVAQELLLRHRARSILIVCPAALQRKWADEMRDKFGLDFRIVDSGLLKQLRRSRGLHVNPWTHFPRLITSIDFLKRERPLRRFRETLPPGGRPTYPRAWDLLILDEAHNVAPSGAGHYATDSLRTLAIRELAPHFEHKLFLTATPHNGYHESFTSLLELLDNQRFARGVRTDERHLRSVVIRRLKSDLARAWDGTSPFAERRLVALATPFGDDERAVHAALRQYTERRLAGATSPAEAFATEFICTLLKKRLFSSPAAFATTLERHLETLATARSRPRPAPPPGILRRRIEADADEDLDDDEAGDTRRDELTDSATRLFRALDDDEHALVAHMRRWAADATARGDARLRTLVAYITTTLQHEGRWNQTRVIIFTEYRATQRWLQHMLTAEGCGGRGRLELMYGGMDDDERERVKAAFQAHPAEAPVRILLATDAASEGIDLQNHCARLIHYDIPWNPARMEQRNGRVDRWGQRAEHVEIHHFVGAGYDDTAPTPDADLRPGDLEGDLEFLYRVARKVDTIRQDLGRVGPVLARQVEEAMLGRRRALDTTRAERDAAALRTVLAAEQRLRERMRRLLADLHDARRDLGLAPARVRHAVDVALALAGQSPLAPAGDGFPADAVHLPVLTGAWQHCADGILHPYTRTARPLVFDDTHARGTDTVVLAHLHHRLVAMSLRLLRAELWSAAGRGRLARVTARLVDDHDLRDPVALVHGRLVVLGSDGTRLHEEVLSAGGRLEAGGFERLTLDEVDRALAARTARMPSEAACRRITALWPRIEAPLVRSLERRAAERTRGLATRLAERRDHDIGAITRILDELDAAIAAELDAQPPAQIELWTSPEREQFDRNVAALRRRRDEIPEERAREVEAIRRRYDQPAPRMFPAAVEFLIPARHDR